jgi:hypothetical protein
MQQCLALKSQATNQDRETIMNLIKTGLLALVLGFAPGINAKSFFEKKAPDASAQVAQDAAKTKAEQEAKAKAEADAKAAQEAKIKAEHDAKVAMEAQAKAKAEADALAKAELDKKLALEAAKARGTVRIPS